MISDVVFWPTILIAALILVLWSFFAKAVGPGDIVMYRPQGTLEYPALVLREDPGSERPYYIRVFNHAYNLQADKIFDINEWVPADKIEPKKLPSFTIEDTFSNLKGIATKFYGENHIEKAGCAQILEDGKLVCERCPRDQFEGVGLHNLAGGPVQVTVRCFSTEKPAIHHMVLADGEQSVFPIRCPGE